MIEIGGYLILGLIAIILFQLGAWLLIAVFRDKDDAPQILETKSENDVQNKINAVSVLTSTGNGNARKSSETDHVADRISRVKEVYYQRLLLRKEMGQILKEGCPHPWIRELMWAKSPAHNTRICSLCKAYEYARDGYSSLNDHSARTIKVEHFP